MLYLYYHYQEVVLLSSPKRREVGAIVLVWCSNIFSLCVVIFEVGATAQGVLYYISQLLLVTQLQSTYTSEDSMSRAYT